MRTCDACGGENAEGARFCAGCGTALPAGPGEPLEVRKTVTVLFCDVVGSTTLGEATDPETTRRVMSRYAQSMTEIVTAHGGTVERFRGDEVMAVFGVPVIHEDDALRAVRAGMEMQRRLTELNAELRSIWGVELACRIGINTGEVVAGDPGTGDTFVTGDAVNLCKRLEQAAQPREILIGTATYPLVKDAVRVGARERFTAKGKRDSVDRFRLDDVDATAAGYARRLDAPLIGRTEELARIQTAIDALVDQGRCGIVSIVGPAGIGKSRMAREIVLRTGSAATVMTGRCLPYGAGITYWPVVELVRDLGGLDAVANALSERADADNVLQSLRSIVAQSERIDPNDEVFWAVRQLLEELARVAPVVVCLEDLHWAEPTMLDLVEYIVSFATGPIVLLCNARPDLLEARPAWARYPLVELGHLSDAETRKLVDAMGVEDTSLRDRIASTAEGNPLFAEQLAVMVTETDHGSSQDLELPASIHALLAARLDGLDPTERRVLERASVVGKEFWRRAITDLSPAVDRPLVGGVLLALARKGLIQPVRGDAVAEDTLRFRHALIRDVAYGSMPKTIRADIHEAFTDWLLEQTGRGFGQHAEIVGYHAEQAFRMRTELGLRDDRTRRLGERAASLLGQAGRQAYARDDMPAASELLGRAAELLPRGDPARLTALRDRAIALWESGAAEEGATALARMRAEASDVADELLVAVADLELVVHDQLVGASARPVEEAAERVIALSTPADDHGALARAWRRLSSARRRSGDSAAAELAARRALEHARAARDTREEARAADALCNCLVYGPTPAGEALAICSTLAVDTRSTRALEAGIAGAAAALHGMLGQFESSRREYERASAILEALGHELARAALTQIGAPLALLLGDPPFAEREARLGEEILRRFDSAVLQAPLIAEAVAAQGRFAEAEAMLSEVSDIAGPPLPQWQVRLSIVQSRLASADGRRDEAVDRAALAVRRSSDTDDVNLRGDSHAALANALALAGELDSALAERDAALVFYERKENVAAARAFEAMFASCTSGATPQPAPSEIDA